MSDIAIRCENLSKRYELGQHESYRALRDVITNAAATPFRHIKARLSSNGNGNGQTHAQEKSIWALKDLSLEIKQGDAVGVIGRNGAGKSTLLKILSRITKPTSGSAKIHGRVGSLLEVGTGFHPELTGRENIFLNGAVLGMRKAEIARKFDEIVAFAEVEKFIDTPVKRYSSGMYVRLAFGVAAHMETEVLLVDEVLAVGDRQFQAKCLGKLNDVTKLGRTVVLVSHQMNQIRRLSDSVIWLDGGTIKDAGPGIRVIPAYEQSALDSSALESRGSHTSFISWKIDKQGHTLTETLKPLSLMFSLWVHVPVSNGHLGVQVYNTENVMVSSWGIDDVSIPEGKATLVLDIPSLPLRPGLYTLSCTLFTHGNNLTGGRIVDRWSANPPLVVETNELSHSQDEWLGLINVPARLRQISE